MTGRTLSDNDRGDVEKGRWSQRLANSSAKEPKKRILEGLGGYLIEMVVKDGGGAMAELQVGKLSG